MRRWPLFKIIYLDSIIMMTIFVINFIIIIVIIVIITIIVIMISCIIVAILLLCGISTFMQWSGGAFSLSLYLCLCSLGGLVRAGTKVPVQDCTRAWICTLAPKGGAD